MSSASVSTALTALTATLFVGTYTRKEDHVNGHAAGIYTLLLNLTTGELTPLQTYSNAGINPSYLTLSNDGKYLYAVNEHSESVSSNNGPSGQILAFSLNSNNELTFLNRQPSQGTFPCYIRVDKSDKYVFTANYGSGSVSMYSRLNDGSLSSNVSDVKYGSQRGSNVVEARQASAHYHCTIESPNNRFVYALDLGSDKVIKYKVDFENDLLVEAGFFASAPGSGPRALVFHPTSNFAYIVNELANSITVVSWDSESGDLTHIQTIRMLPEDFVGESLAGDIQVCESGRFLYASNRGHDSIAIFEIDTGSGSLRLNEFVATEGGFPRSFLIYRDLLLVANQNSDSIVSFRRDYSTGSLTRLSSFSVPTPVCLKIKA